MTRTFIITQRQLNEIVTGNPTYLDNLGNDFKEDGANQVYTGEKYDDHDSDPETTNDVAKQLRRDVGFYGSNRTNNLGMPVYSESVENSNELTEDNQNLVNRTYGDSNNRVTDKNASVMKSRYNNAYREASSTNPVVRQRGLSKMNNMRKNNPNIDTIQTQYDNAHKNDANLKKFAKNRGEENVYQKENGTKTYGNGKAHTSKPVGSTIIYDEE